MIAGSNSVEPFKISVKRCHFSAIILEPLQKEKIKIPEVEKITDEFAIGFAKWCGVPIVAITIEELLEIYKKEKGL